MRKIVNGKGGLMAHLGTNEAHIVVKNAEQGDEKSRMVLDAMCYQIAKTIGGCAAVLKGDVDGIVITGGIAHGKSIVNYIKDMVSWIAPIKVYVITSYSIHYTKLYDNLVILN